MAYINIYKIDSTKEREFFTCISEKLTLQANKNLEREDQEDIVLSLYVANEHSKREVSWNWIMSEFELEKIDTSANPKAVLTIAKDSMNYAITFGFSYFIVDKFCDRNFAFNFARKVEFKEIKTTALSSPNIQRNKTINTYINYNELEFDSGESFAKLKAKIKLEENFDLYKELVEVGSSIKFNLIENTIENIVLLINHIESISDLKDRYKIPVFYKIKDGDIKEELNKGLKERIITNIESINISEFDIIGSNEIFNHNDVTFKLKYEKYQKKITDLSIMSLKEFLKENKLNFENALLEIKVVSYKDGTKVRTDRVFNLIDYINESEKCILIKGEWFKFNDDYLQYLKDSISEINVIYEPQYDFWKEKHKKYIEMKYLEEKNNPEFDGKSDEEKLKKVTNKYYAERYYNIMLSEEFGFELYDRENSKIGTAKIELMDLYKDKTMFVVKKGKSSDKLCYAVDQSLVALKSYKHNLIKDKPTIEKVGIWLILERKNKLSKGAAQPDINELDLLLLKNKLDSWKKEVRLLGYIPLIYINYVQESIDAP